MPKLLFRTSSSNEHYNADCDFVVISIDKDYAKQLLARIQKAKALREEDSSFHELLFFDYSPEPFAWDDFIEDFVVDGVPLLEQFDTADIIILSDAFELPENVEIERTESSHVRIYADSDVAWDFAPRHSDITIWCGYLSVDILGKIADGDTSIEVMPEKAKKETAAS